MEGSLKEGLRLWRRVIIMWREAEERQGSGRSGVRWLWCLQAGVHAGLCHPQALAWRKSPVWLVHIQLGPSVTCPAAGSHCAHLHHTHPPPPPPVHLQYTSQPFTAGDKVQLLTTGGGKVIEGECLAWESRHHCWARSHLAWRTIAEPVDRAHPFPLFFPIPICTGVVQSIEPSRTVIRVEDGSPVYIANADILNYLVK